MKAIKLFAEDFNRFVNRLKRPKLTCQGYRLKHTGIGTFTERSYRYGDFNITYLSRGTLPPELTVSFNPDAIAGAGDVIAVAKRLVEKLPNSNQDSA